MDVSYVVIVAIVTYVLGTFPIQNLIIALVSTLICYFTKIEPNFMQSFILCLMATMGAGGISDLMSVLKGSE